MTNDSQDWQQQPPEAEPAQPGMDRETYPSEGGEEFTHPDLVPPAKRFFGPTLLVAVLAVALLGSVGGIVILALSVSAAKEAAAAKVRDAEEQARQAAQQARNVQLTAHENARIAQQRLYQMTAATDVNLQNERRARQQEAAARQNQYVAQIRLAKHAWDRGEIAHARRILEPYREDETKRSLRDFAWFYLWRAAHSGGALTLREHAGVLRQAAFTPDGASVITLGDDGALVFSDAAGGKKLHSRVLEQSAAVRNPYAPSEESLAQQAGGLAVTSDGQWWAAYGETLWRGDLAHPDQARPMKERSAPIIAMAMTRDGKLLATGDYQGEIVLRELPDGRIVRRWANPRSQAMTFTPQGKFLMVGSLDGGLYVWDVTTGALQTSASFGQEITSLAIARDELVAAVALADREGVVCLWDATTGKIRAELRGHHDIVTRVVFDSEGKRLITASRDQTACLWSTTGRLIKTFRGHLGAVEAAAFSPDGRKIVTAGDDGDAMLWDAEGDPESEALAGSPAYGWVESLVFAPDGGQLIGAGCCETSDAFLTSWNLAKSNVPVPLQTSSRAGTAIAVSADGRSLAVGEGASPEAAAKSRLRVWSLETGRITATVPGLAGTIHSVAFSPEGRLLAVATGDVDEKMPGVVRILDAATGVMRSTLPEMAGKVEVAFTPDGRLLVTVNGGKRRPGEIRLWSAASGELVERIESPGELEDVTAMALAPGGQYLVTGHGNVAPSRSVDSAKLKLWDLAAKRLFARFPAAHQAAVTQIAFSRRGLLMASGDSAGEVRIWDFPMQKLLAKQIPRQAGPIHSLAFDVLGERIVTGTEEKCFRVWHIDTAREMDTLNLALGMPTAARFTPDGKSLAGTTTAGGVYLWDAETCRPRAVLRAEGNPAGADGHAGRVTCAVLPPIDGRLLTGSTDKTVKMWDLKTCKFQATALTLERPVASMAISPDGKRVAIGTGRYKTKFEPGELLLCRPESPRGRSDAEVLFAGIVPTSLAFSPDGKTLAVCSMAVHPVKGPLRNVALFNLTTGKAAAVASSLPQSVAFSPEGNLLAVGRVNGEIDLWRLEAFGAAEAKPAVLQGHLGTVAALCFSPDGKTLVSGAYDNNVKVWDVATREELLTLKHNGAVEAVQFSGDGKILATADREALHGGVRLWRAASDDR